MRTRVWMLICDECHKELATPKRTADPISEARDWAVKTCGWHMERSGRTVREICRSCLHAHDSTTGRWVG